MDREVTPWTGWVMFASWMLILSGIINFFFGLGGVLRADWYLYANGTAYWLSTENWGWWTMFMASLIGLSGALLLMGNWFGRTMGTVFAFLSLLANAALLPVAPVWSMIAIVVNVLVIYAILAHGGEMKTLAHESS